MGFNDGWTKRSYFDMGGITKACTMDFDAEPEPERPELKSTDNPDLREPIVALQAYKQNFDLIDWSK